MRSVRSIFGVKSSEKMKYVDITPDIANEILRDHRKDVVNNEDVDNRRPTEAKRYLYDMRNGLWDNEAISTIIFDKDDYLIDGQNRMLALSQQNNTYKFIVVFDCKRSIYTDVGKSRNVIDNLRCNHLVSSDILGKRSREIMNFMLAQKKMSSGKPFPNESTEIFKYYEKELLAYSPIMAYKLRAPIHATLFIAYLNGVSLNKLADFAAIAAHSRKGSATPGENTVHCFREKMCKIRGGGAGINKTVYGLSQYALHHYLKDNEVQRFREDKIYFDFSLNFLNIDAQNIRYH